MSRAARASSERPPSRGSERPPSRGSERPPSAASVAEGGHGKVRKGKSAWVKHLQEEQDALWMNVIDQDIDFHSAVVRSGAGDRSVTEVRHLLSSHGPLSQALGVDAMVEVAHPIEFVMKEKFSIGGKKETVYSIWLDPELAPGPAVRVSKAVFSTALILAVMRGHVEMVHLLVKEGDADVHLSEGLVNGWSALMWACALQNHEMARELCRLGASPMQREASKRGHTCLEIAMQHGCSDLALEMIPLVWLFTIPSDYHGTRVSFRDTRHASWHCMGYKYPAGNPGLALSSAIIVSNAAREMAHGYSDGGAEAEILASLNETYVAAQFSAIFLLETLSPAEMKLLLLQTSNGRDALFAAAQANCRLLLDDAGIQNNIVTLWQGAWLSKVLKLRAQTFLKQDSAATHASFWAHAAFTPFLYLANLMLLPCIAMYPPLEATIVKSFREYAAFVEQGSLRSNGVLSRMSWCILRYLPVPTVDMYLGTVPHFKFAVFFVGRVRGIPPCKADACSHALATHARTSRPSRIPAASALVPTRSSFFPFGRPCRRPDPRLPTHLLPLPPTWCIACCTAATDHAHLPDRKPARKICVSPI